MSEHDNEANTPIEEQEESMVEKEETCVSEETKDENPKTEKKENFFKNIYNKLGKKNTIIIGSVVAGVVAVLLILLIVLLSVKSCDSGNTDPSGSTSGGAYSSGSSSGSSSAGGSSGTSSGTTPAPVVWTPTKELTYELDTTTDTYTITGLESTFDDTVICIPDTYEGKKVVAVKESAFSPDSSDATLGSKLEARNAKVTKIYISGNVKSIGTQSFICFTNATELILNEGTETIEDLAFGMCGFEKVTLPSTLKTIGKGAFLYNGHLQEITIPNSVTSIGEAAFEDCYELTKATLPNGITVIPEGLFDGCYRLYDITIPDSVTTIETYAFDNTGLMSITIPKSVTTLADRSFIYCEKLVEITNKSAIEITPYSGYSHISAYTDVINPATSGLEKDGDYYFYTKDSQTYLISYVGRDTELTLPEKHNNAPYTIYRNAFKGCTLLESVVIPDTVTTIGTQAFIDCLSLKNVEIGSGVTTIESGAFTSCKALESITIPKNVTTINWTGAGIFQNCHALKTITCEAYTQPSGWYTGSNGLGWLGDNTPFNSTSVYFDANAKIIWNQSLASQGLSYTLNADGTSYSVSGIGTCTDTEIYIPSTYNEKPVTGIANNAFEYNTRITKIEFPSSMQKIGSSAFYYCTVLNSVTLNFGLTEIGENAFLYARLSGVLTIPATVSTMGEGAFSQTNVTEVTLPSSCTNIPKFLFDGCANLQIVTLPGSINSIGEKAFYNVDSGKKKVFYYKDNATRWDAITKGAEWCANGGATIHCDNDIVLTVEYN